LSKQEVIPVADPGAQLIALRPEIDEAIIRVLNSGYYILGPEVEAFEREFADYIGTTHAVGVANGTDALALGLRSLGIGPGDEVITVSHTAVATVAAIEQAGATPVLVDVEPGFLTLDPALLDEVLTDRTRAVVPVHLYGQAADLTRIQSFCALHNLALVEDSSQAHGTTWGGAKLGSIGHIGVFSCYPTKNLGALGDAGIVVTNDPVVADRLRRLRQYGWQDRNLSLEPGVNSRLDELQAAILRVKLRHLDSGNAARRAIAARYTSALAGTPIRPPTTRSEVEHVFHLYVIEDSDREALRERLAQRGVGSAVHYPLAVHQQSAYNGRIRTSSSMAVTEEAVQRILSLPMFPELDSASIDRVVRAVELSQRRRT
jgi:dTDP-4-amino-4,6-dideoxygalactose transaminase